MCIKDTRETVDENGCVEVLISYGICNGYESRSLRTLYLNSAKSQFTRSLRGYKGPLLEITFVISLKFFYPPLPLCVALSKFLSAAFAADSVPVIHQNLLQQLSLVIQELLHSACETKALRVVLSILSALSLLKKKRKKGRVARCCLKRKINFG